MSIWYIFAYAMLPVIGNVIGGILAEGVKAPGWVVGAALHAAAGIAIALVSIDLMPRILGAIPTWALVLAFLGGALATVLLANMVSRFTGGEATKGNRKAWMVYVAVGADLVSDGLVTGVGAAIGTSLGFLIAASQSVANIPGGFAAAANLRLYDIPRWQRLSVSIAMGIPVILSTLIGYWLLGGASEFTQNLALAFIVGVLLLATVEDILPQGDAPAPHRWISTAAFSAGFCVFAILSRSLS